MAHPDRRPTTPYSAAFYGETDDELGPGRVGFDVFYPNPVLDLAEAEFQTSPIETAQRMQELADALLEYPNLPIKMTVNLGGTAATQLDLEDVLATFRQKVAAGYKYHGDEFEAQKQEGQSIVANFLRSLSAPLDSLCSMRQSGSLTDFSTSFPKDTYKDPSTMRPILNTITAYRLQSAVQSMRFPPQKAPVNHY